MSRYVIVFGKMFTIFYVNFCALRANMNNNPWDNLIELKFTVLAELGADVDTCRRAYREQCEALLAWRQSEFSAIFWNLAVTQNIRPQLPEAVANAIPFGALGLVDYLTASAPTAEVFFYQLQQHLTRLIEFINLEIVENSETFSVHLQSLSRVDSTYSLRFFRSLIVQRFQRAFPSCFDPKIIVGGDLDQSVNGGPITVSNTSNGKTIFVLEISKVNAKKALASSDKYLFKVLERSALAVLPPKRALNVVLAIRKQLPSTQAISMSCKPVF